MNSNVRKVTNTESNKKQIKVDIDTILVDEIGEFGKFHLKIFVLATICGIFGAWCVGEFIFTTARIPTRCLVPECDGDVPEWSPSWLPNAIPATGETTFDNCQRFVNTSLTILRQVDDVVCTSTLFDRNNVQDCEEYVYENTNTVVYDFKLACDDWRRSLIGTIRFSGTIAGMFITAYISDHWGRRTALSITGFNRAWIGVTRYWANTYVGFTTSELLESFFGAGFYSIAHILVLELMGPKYRPAGGAITQTISSIGYILLGLIAWGIPNWRHLTLVLYIPQFVTIFLYWVMPESVRWYLSKGRFDDCENMLKKIAKTNGTPISEESLKSLRDTAEEKAAQKASQEESKRTEPWLIVQVFQHKQILLRVLVSSVWWITTNLIYYGLSFNAVNMSGNKYLNYIAVMAVEIPGFWTAYFLMARIGRKAVLIVAFWVCAIFQIAYIFTHADQNTLSLLVYLIAKYTIAVVSITIHVYTAELYPTTHRQSLYTFSNFIGKIGIALAPLTSVLGAQLFEELPFVLFAAFTLLSGALAFTTPETLSTKLPETFDEAVRIGTKQDSND